VHLVEKALIRDEDAAAVDPEEMPLHQPIFPAQLHGVGLFYRQEGEHNCGDQEQRWQPDLVASKMCLSIHEDDLAVRPIFCFEVVLLLNEIKFLVGLWLSQSWE